MFLAILAWLAGLAAIFIWLVRRQDSPRQSIWPEDRIAEWRRLNQPPATPPGVEDPAIPANEP